MRLGDDRGLSRALVVAVVAVAKQTKNRAKAKTCFSIFYFCAVLRAKHIFRIADYACCLSIVVPNMFSFS